MYDIILNNKGDNMQYFLIVLLLIVSYLLGSIPFGLVIGKVVKKIDIREYGSKNTGATNAVRILGFKLGVLCFFLDALKGGLIIIIVRILMATNVELGFQLVMIKINENINITITALYGLTAVLGHVFPIFLKFKGGKAVATSVGALLAFAPVIGMLGILVFYITLKMSGYASLGSLMGASTSLLTLIVYDLFMGKGDYGVLYFEYSKYNWANYSVEVISVFLYVLIIFLRHRSNIDKLNKGTESRFEFEDEEN